MSDALAYQIAIDLLEELTPLAETIAKEVHGGRVYGIRRFERDRVVFTYNDSCHCHPEEAEDGFPAAWLFDPDWRVKLEAEQRRRAEERAKKIEADRLARAAAQEASERQAYERLRVKYEEGPAGG